MGFASFLCWIWSGNSPLPLASPAPPFRSSPDDAHVPNRVTFTLQARVYAWLEAMAVLHNYGSVHKSIRDLLAWASAGRPDDMEWLFATEHSIPPTLDFETERCHEAAAIAFTQCARGGGVVTVHARLSETLHAWIDECVHRFRLGGPSVVLDAVCRCAVELHAADDVFESDETGHDLPVSSAELYHDLGIMRSPAFGNVRTGCT